MPAIRFPASAVPLLPLCKGHGDNYIFRTYADLIGFVAAYGYHLVTNEGQRLPAKPTFTDTPNAIGLEVFENRGQYANFVMIALAHDDTRELAENEDLLAKTIEQFAALGAAVISTKVNGSEHSASISTIIEIISTTYNEFRI
jgi:hypothetical protein